MFIMPYFNQFKLIYTTSYYSATRSTLIPYKQFIYNWWIFFIFYFFLTMNDLKVDRSFSVRLKWLLLVKWLSIFTLCFSHRYKCLIHVVKFTKKLSKCCTPSIFLVTNVLLTILLAFMYNYYPPRKKKNLPILLESTIITFHRVVSIM